MKARMKERVVFLHKSELAHEIELLIVGVTELNGRSSTHVLIDDVLMKGVSYFTNFTGRHELTSSFWDSSFTEGSADFKNSFRLNF
jgi:hypothetical protein